MRMHVVFSMEEKDRELIVFKIVYVHIAQEWLKIGIRNYTKQIECLREKELKLQDEKPHSSNLGRNCRICIMCRNKMMEGRHMPVS